MNDKLSRDRRIFEALNGIDEKYIAEVTEHYEVFDPCAGYAPTRRAKIRIYSRIAALAACILLVALCLPAISRVLQQIGIIAPSTEVPVTTEIPETDTPKPETDDQTTPPDPDTSVFDSYASIIEIMENISNICTASGNIASDRVKYEVSLNIQSDSDRKWFGRLFDSAMTARYDSDLPYGYSVGDINGDGTDELLYLREDHMLLAVFTQKDEPVLLESFTDRYRGYIDIDGRIFAFDADDGHPDAAVYEISESRDALATVAALAMTGSHYTDMGAYKLTGDVREEITRDEYWKLIKEAPFKDEDDLHTEKNPGVKFTGFSVPEEKFKYFTDYESIIEIMEDISRIYAFRDTIYMPDEVDRLGEKYDIESATERKWYNAISRAAADWGVGGGYSFGYSVGDINGDGVKELIYMLDDHNILALFTICEGKPLMLEAFTARYTGLIDKDGRIYASGSSGLGDWSNTVYKISEKCDSLQPIAEIGGDGVTDEGEYIYYKLENGEKLHISKDEYDSLSGRDPFSAEYGKDNNKGIKFIAFEYKKPILSDEEIIKIFEEVYSNKREVRYADGGILFGNIHAYGEGYLFECKEPKAAYVDLDGDGMLDAVVHIQGKGDFLISYDSRFDHVYVHSISPDKKYNYYTNGEYGTDSIRYRVISADGYELNTETVDYKASGKEPIKETVKWEDITIGYKKTFAYGDITVNYSVVKPELTVNYHLYVKEDHKSYLTFTANEKLYNLRVHKLKKTASGYEFDKCISAPGDVINLTPLLIGLEPYDIIGISYKFSDEQHFALYVSGNDIVIEEFNPGAKETLVLDTFDDVLEQYKQIIELCYDPDATIETVRQYPYRYFEANDFSSEGKYALNGIINSLFPVLPEKKSDLGYSIGDINGDGADELILMQRDNTIMALFTTYQGKAVFCEGFAGADIVNLDAEGIIHLYSESAGGAREVWQLWELPAGQHYTTENMYLAKGSSADGTYYIQDIGNTTTSLTKTEYEKLISSAPLKYLGKQYTSENRNVKFVPLYEAEIDRSYIPFKLETLSSPPANTSFHAYIGDQSESVEYLLFSALEKLENVRFYLLDSSMVEYELGELLYSLPSLSPEKPFLAGVVFHGDMTAYGLSFTDPDGNERHFAITMGGFDGTSGIVAREFTPAVLDSLEYGVFTLREEAEMVDEYTFRNVDTELIKEIVIGRNVKKIDFAYLNTIPNLKRVTVNPINRYYTSIVTVNKANVLISKKTDEMMFFTSEGDYIDLWDEKELTSFFKAQDYIKMYTGGGVLILYYTGGTNWILHSVEYGGLRQAAKYEMDITGNISFKAFRHNDGFATCYTYYGASHAFIFSNGKAAEYNPLTDNGASYYINYKGDGIVFSRGESGELVYVRTAEKMKAIQNNEWYVGYLKSPNVIWKTEGVASISGNKIVYTQKYEYTVEDYLKEEGTTLRAWFEYMQKEEKIKYKSLNELFVSQGGKKYYPDKITKYSDAEMIKIYEEVFAGKREIVSMYDDCFYERGSYLSECGSYSGKYLWESLYHKVFYYDYNDDGILDALYRPSHGADSDYLLHYQDGKVYAICISPRSGYSFYGNGELGNGAAIRYRITEFDGLDFEMEMIDYSKWTYSEPYMEYPEYISIDLLRPGQTSRPVSDKELADFSSYDSIIKMLKKAFEMVKDGEVTKDNITTYEKPYRFSDGGSDLRFHYMVLCAHYYMPRGERFGYSVGDINGDGTDELIFMLEDHTPMMIFTMYEGSPVYVRMFDKEDTVYIDTDGRIHEFKDYWVIRTAVYELSGEGKGLDLLESVQLTEDPNGDRYYHITPKYVWGNENRDITKEEYERISAGAPFKKEEDLHTEDNPGVRFVAFE